MISLAHPRFPIKLNWLGIILIQIPASHLHKLPRLRRGKIRQSQHQPKVLPAQRNVGRNRGMILTASIHRSESTHEAAGCLQHLGGLPADSLGERFGKPEEKQLRMNYADRDGLHRPDPLNQIHPRVFQVTTNGVAPTATTTLPPTETSAAGK